MKRDEDGYEETPRWRLLMYPIGGAVGVLIVFAVWIAFS